MAKMTVSQIFLVKGCHEQVIKLIDQVVGDMKYQFLSCEFAMDTVKAPQSGSCKKVYIKGRDYVTRILLL